MVLGQHGYEVGQVSGSTSELIAWARREQPDACLIDRSAPRDGDAATIAALRAVSGETAVLMLGADPSPEAADRAIAAGAAGYVHQSRSLESLVAGLGRALAGEVVVDLPDAAPVRRPRRPDPAQRLAERLTARERECLMMLLEGLDTAAMIERLGVSRTTVRTHLQAVRTKLGVHSRLEAASFAVRHRLAETWSVPAPAPGAAVRTAVVAPAAKVQPIRPARPGTARRTATARTAAARTAGARAAGARAVASLPPAARQ